MRSIRSFYFIKLTTVAFILWAVAVMFDTRLGINQAQIISMVGFLWAVFVIAGLFYIKIKNKTGSTFLLRYSLLFILKFTAALGGAFLFLSPDDENIKSKALFFLFSYFILLMFDISTKVGDLNKKLDK